MQATESWKQKVLMHDNPPCPPPPKKNNNNNKKKTDAPQDPGSKIQDILQGGGGSMH